MRIRTVLLLATTAAAFAPAAASGAMITPYCTTRLADATAGTAAYCDTEGLPDLGNRSAGAYRTVTIAVAQGSVDAYLVCDGQTQTRHVAAGTVGKIERWGGRTCRTSLVAAEDHTTAVATSVGSYVFNLE